ncbi:MAG TPA: hypothetical protein VN154_08285 [Rhizomicrobium sp.]|nr:hypothetical protein [Rhizomicrobium sp.]
MTRLFDGTRALARDSIASGDNLTHLDEVVAELRRSREATHNIRRGGRPRKMPSRAVLGAVTEQVLMALFPTHYGSLDLMHDGIDKFVSGILGHALPGLTQQVRLDLALKADEPELDRVAIAEESDRIVADFAAQLPKIRAVLVSDLVASFESDPDATSIPEILLGYPGLTATAYHRLAHTLFQLGAALSARLIGSIAHSKTSIDLHPGAEIGPNFSIQTGTGVVVGASAIIGSRVRLHQAVTLGAPDSRSEEGAIADRNVPRHPILEDDVVIHAGATILGRITIGKGSVIGGNVWLTHDVAPGSRISQAPLRRE